MIRIPISENQKEEIETLYWNWIRRYHLQQFLTVMEADKDFKALIVEDQEDKSVALQKFLLSDYDKLAQIKMTIDQRGTELNQETANYLRARYKNYRDSQAAKVANVLGMIACPYCNQNHINAGYDKEGKFKFWGDLDHFYNKHAYPEMAVCLYNLIPVCKVCNHIKGSKKTVIVNPYNCKTESGIKFRTEFDESFDLDYLQGKSQNFQIVIDKNDLCLEDESEIELFELENRYKNLRRNVQEIIIKSKAYERIYEESLKEDFELSDGEFNAYFFGYTENHLDRVLSKFNQDISNEFRNSNE